MRHPPCPKLAHDGRLARYRELLRPSTILPREISPQTIFEVRLSPSGLEVLLSLCGVLAVQTILPITAVQRESGVS